MSCNCQEIAEKGKQKVEESLAMRLVQDTRKQSKRWFVAWLVTFLTLLVVLSGIVYFALTSNVSVNDVEQTVSGNGYANFVGNNGDIDNGTPKS